ncbi:agmatine deiminase family protein [Thioalkalivibrio sp. XN8]|uniref:agmatine deiminase family protein n=1 Tax=Thioalkalivibrio sp. XN8 TaxID=2712863 RepID=UPI0013E99FCD|nr:agmatine deiminase family protein [Thioalkalivibrio sp. XN8]NGP52640.1 agmatine deiminase family protein [Thioalkalivibrio sp. XN8]
MNLPRPAPAELGFAMPAEWAPHQATWISWPHNPDTWPGVLQQAEAAMAQAVTALAAGETVRINVLDAEHEAHVRGLLGAIAETPAVVFHAIPTNDAWCRDHGAIFVRDDAGELAAVDCGFNAWGGKYPPWDLDDAVPAQMAAALGLRRFEAGMILEGGSIDVNGAGTLLTTEQCLLNPNRNPGLDRADIEARLELLFGARQVLWLGDGIVGDDTDGHVDDITRFVAEDTVVTAVEPDPADPNHAPLAENLERLRAMRLPDGRPLRIIELPMPEPVELEGDRLPASYGNFYIANQVVLLPVFDQPRDAEAARILQPCFPDRRVVPIRANELVVGLGAFHCLTQQVPMQ